MRMMRLLAVVMAASAFLFTGLEAAASPSPQHPSVTPPNEQAMLAQSFDQYCFIMLKPVTAEQAAAGNVSESTPIECYDSQAEQQQAIEGRSSEQAAAFAADAETQRSASVCYNNGPIGYTFTSDNYSGGRLDWWSYQCWEPLCYDGSRFLYPYLPAGWNDAIASAYTLDSGACSVRLWDNEAVDGNFYPPVQTCISGCAYLSPTRVASAISFRPRYEGAG